MDLAAFMAATAAAAVEPAKGDQFPTFPNPRDGCGNGQHIDNKEISRNSRVSHAPEVDQGSTSEKSLRARVCAHAGERAREVPSEGAGNAGTAGNARKDNGLSFPHQPLKVGKVGKEGRSPVTALLPVGDGVALWRAGLARLVGIDLDRPTAGVGYRPGEWSKVYARAVTFLDQFGGQAEALGWTAPRLFGVHPIAGIVRVDACGALVLPTGGAVRAITATEVNYGHLTYREKPGQPAGVPWWEFGR